MNLVEILKQCPKGMELDCVMYDNVYLEQVDEKAVYPIVIRIGKTDTICLTKEGHWNKFPNAKCVIFPKGKNTWIISKSHSKLVMLFVIDSMEVLEFLII